jgi:Transglutaminase-like superfamily
MLHFEQQAVPQYPMRAQSYPLSGGDAGVEQTIAAMRRLIDEGKKDPLVHEAAANILRNARIRAFDWMGEVQSIGEWVGRNIRFTRDVYGKETLHSAREIIRLGIGDCDDFTILICSLLGTIGVKTQIKTISSPRLDPSQFTHVYPEAEVEGRWIPVDFARRDPHFGQGPENVSRVRAWSTSSDQYTDIQGLQGLAGSNPMKAVRGPRRYAPPLAGLSGVAAARGPLFNTGLGLGPAGFAPNALPGAYQSNVPDPRFRTLRSTPFLGTGHYGMKSVRRAMYGKASKKKPANGMGVGDDSEFADIAPIITAAGSAATNIIRAETSPAVPILPTYTALPAASGLSSSDLLFGVLGIGAVLLLSQRGK